MPEKAVIKINVTSKDIQLSKQNHRHIYITLKILNEALNTIGYIKGRLVSGSVQINSDSSIRRSASITMETERPDINIGTDIAVHRYIKLMCGIENDLNTEAAWYSLGIFIVNSSSLKFDPQTRTLSLELSDMMIDLTGERTGAIHAYTTVVKNSERIDTVIKNVLDMSGVRLYDICAVGMLRELDDFTKETPEDDFLVPYDLKFSVGDTAYDILEKCVTLYPYYEMGFDPEGVFYCRRSITDGDNSRVLIDAYALDGLILSEDLSIDWTGVKNVIEVWGKDGLSHGEAYDTEAGSPFNTASTKEMRLVVTDNEHGVDTDNIYDRYKDTELAAELLKEQAEYENTIADIEAIDESERTAEEQQELETAQEKLISVKQKQKQNIDISGNDLAQQWAERLLYEYARMNDTVSLQTVLLPFVNDTGFKISYRSQSDGRIRIYKVKNVSHDLSSGTTTLECIRFYGGSGSMYTDMLDTPEITDCGVSYMTVTLDIQPVKNAQYYNVYIDGRLAVRGTGTTISFILPDSFAGTHSVYVTASANGYATSAESNKVTIILKNETFRLITEDGSFISTENEERILFDP